jgi:hypothetical protein
MYRSVTVELAEKVRLKTIGLQIATGPVDEHV